MNKKEILKRLLEKGILLSPEELKNMDNKKYDEILKNKNNDEINKEKAPEKTKISSTDIINYYKKVYETITKILLNKMDAVSINKGKNTRTEISIVGRVKNTSISSFTFEDVTGETEVVYNKNDIEEGDIIGINGTFREDKFFPNQIVWPDVPLEKTPKPADKKILMSSKNIGGMELVVHPPTKKGDIKTDVFGGIIISSYKPTEKITQERALKIMKRRMIYEQFSTNKFIEKIPNIFWMCANEKNWTKNYRGVVIISTDNESSAVYDSNRIVFKKI